MKLPLLGAKLRVDGNTFQKKQKIALWDRSIIVNCDDMK
jgi:hypothetical protein